MTGKLARIGITFAEIGDDAADLSVEMIGGEMDGGVAVYRLGVEDTGQLAGTIIDVMSRGTRRDPDQNEPGDGMLSNAEHRAVRKSAELFNALCAIVPPGEAQDQDLREIAHLIHSIQGRILGQAAARAYPGLYRPLGGWPDTGPSTRLPS